MTDKPLKRFLFRGLALLDTEAIGEGTDEPAAKLDAIRKMRKQVEKQTGRSVMVTSVSNKSIVPRSDGTNGPVKTVTEVVEAMEEKA